MANPEAAKGMAEVYKEVAKLDGVPVQQVISMGAEGQPGTPSQPQQQAERPTIGGMLGSRLGIGKKKKESEAAPPPQQQPANTNTAPNSLLEMTTELSGFSSGAVDDGQFVVPPGFKKVEPDFKRAR